MTSSAGWNSQVFRGRKRISEHCKHLEQVFGGKRANLEAQAAHLTPDTKNALFGVRRFQRFLLQKRSGDEAVTSLVTSSAGWKLCSFEPFWDQNSQIIRTISLLSLLLRPTPKSVFFRVRRQMCCLGLQIRSFSSKTGSRRLPCSKSVFCPEKPANSSPLSLLPLVTALSPLAFWVQKCAKAAPVSELLLCRVFCGPAARRGPGSEPNSLPRFST